MELNISLIGVNWDFFQKTEFGFDLCGLVAILADFLGYHLRLDYRGNFSSRLNVLCLKDIKLNVMDRVIF